MLRLNPLIRWICTLTTVLSFAGGASAQTQQPVVFLEDVNWSTTPQFQAHSNWTSENPSSAGNLEYQAVLGQVQAIIGSGKRPIIHLIMGALQPLASPGDPHSLIFAYWASYFDQIITAVQKAKLTIIVGTIPVSGPPNDVSDMNKWIFAYCTAHNVPVVNYDFALNSGTGFSAGGSSSPTAQPGTLAEGGPTYFTGTAPFLSLNAAAYSVMTDMAETAILLAEGYKLKGGFLNNVVFNGDDVEDFEDYPTVNSNSVYDGGYVQFTPYGQYTDGSTHIFNNADVNGHLGTWVNTNPLVLSLDLTGAGRGLDGGTTDVRFITPQGTYFSEWVQSTVVDDYGCPSNCPTTF